MGRKSFNDQLAYRGHAQAPCELPNNLALAQIHEECDERIR
jgi:hypothetical protein